MWFKNLHLFRLDEPFTLSSDELGNLLEQKPARSCGGLELSTLGWSAPLGRNGHTLVHSISSYLMVNLCKEEKMLPASVIQDHVDETVADIEDREGREIGRRERSEIKERVQIELLPQALSRRIYTQAYIDSKEGWVIVNSASAKKAEELIGVLRESIGQLKLHPLTVTKPVHKVMTSWLLGDPLPASIKLLDECELRDRADEHSIIRCKGQDLLSDEVNNHLKVGKEAIKLALEWSDRIAFTLHDDLSIRRLQFLDEVLEQASDANAESAAEQFDADFAIMTAEISYLLPILIDVFGGEVGQQSSDSPAE